MHARALHERVFGSQISVEDLLRKHSQAGLWGNFLNEATETKWFTALAAGDHSSNQRLLSVRMIANARVRLGRKCPICLKHDLHKFGFGHWHVLHQIPIVRHCHIHACRLVTSCSLCDAASGSLRPAHITCSACSDLGQMELSTKAYESSSGYQDTLTFLADLYIGRLPPFRPKQRSQLFSAAFGEGPTRRSLDFLPMFLSAWHFPSYEAFSHEFRVTDAKSVRALLQGFYVPAPLSLIAATTAFALSKAGPNWSKSIPTIDYSTNELFQTDPSLSIALLHQSIDCLQEQGCPIGTLPLLLNGQPRSKMAEELGFTANRLLQLEEKLPREVRNEIRERRERRPQSGWTSERTIRAREKIEHDREPHRAIALQCKANGYVTRYKLGQIAPQTITFLRMHDPEWFQREFPLSPKRGTSTERQALDPDKEA